MEDPTRDLYCSRYVDTRLFKVFSHTVTNFLTMCSLNGKGEGHLLLVHVTVVSVQRTLALSGHILIVAGLTKPLLNEVTF